MAVWHWMYDHPQASPQELNQATVQISKDMWNRYYAPVFRKNDVVLLGVYSHMIDAFLYLPDYPIGHLIAFQIEQQMKKVGPSDPNLSAWRRWAPSLLICGWSMPPDGRSAPKPCWKRRRGRWSRFAAVFS